MILKGLLIFKYIKSLEYSIIALQETHSTNKDEKYWTSQWGGQAYFSHGESNARGVMFLINRKSPVKVNKCTGDTQGRTLFLDIEIEGTQMVLANIYAPNQDTPIFFTNIGRQLADLDVEKKILLGDLNLTLKDEDMFPVKPHINVKAHSELIKIMEENDLVDIYRDRHQDNHYTWERYNPDRYAARLDYVLSTASLDSIIQHVDFDNKFRSDHDIPYITCIIEKNVRGPGFWRFNTTLLVDKQCVQLIKDTIAEEKQKPFKSNILKWDNLKCALRGKIVQYTAQKKRSKQNKMRIYENKIAKFKEQLNNPQKEYIYNEKQIKQRISQLELEVENLIESNLRKSMLRARRNWFEFGEKNSKYFFNLEKYKYSQKK